MCLYRLSTQTLTTYRVELPTLPAPDDYTPRAAIQLPGTGTIKSVSLVPFDGCISEVFDSAPYRNLSEDLSPTELLGTVDTKHELSIDGHVEIKRSKWFWYYRHPNCIPRQLDKFAAERGFYPGRRIFKFEPVLKKLLAKTTPVFMKIACRRSIPIQLFFARYRANQFKKPREHFRSVPVARPGKTNTLRLEKQPCLTVTSIRIEAVY